MPTHESERRKDYRLPFEHRIILTDGIKSITAHGANLSRGGMFALTLNPFAIETPITIGFILPQQPGSLCLRGRIAHIVMDKTRCEVDCGLGLEFLDLTDAQKMVLNIYMTNQKTAYLELKEILALERPDNSEIKRYMEKLPSLKGSDLLSLRYKVNRICTLFEPSAMKMSA